MIHVCYCFRDKTGHYAKFAGISLLSVFENTDYAAWATGYLLTRDI